jgi:twitching motility protein PilT
LVTKLKESGADRVVFTPNDPGVAFDGEVSRLLPGKPVSGATLLDAVSEMLSHDDIAGLSANRPRVVRHEHDGEDFVFEIIKHGSGVALAVRPARQVRAVKPSPAAMPRRMSKRMRASMVPTPEPTIELAESPPKKARRSSASLVPALVDAPLVEEVVVTTKSQGPPKIDGLLREMIAKKASDLHLTGGVRPVLRVDGEIHLDGEGAALSSADILGMVQEIMTPRAREDFEGLSDADFAYEVPGLARFRVNVFQDRNGTGAVLRQIPIEVLSAEQLGLPKACLDLSWLSKGLVLVTGPTGSGKSTTLAAMIDFINKNRSDHIITIEDPIEFVHENRRCLVNQREVGQHTRSFKAALRAALREDPDIVLVGELRDLETIAIAIETAETGHLVFGTLHTTTAISTVDRIIDQFPPDRQQQIRVMLSESLKGVVAQVLCPKIGGGRVAAHEILLGSHAVASRIREGKTFQLASVMQTSKQQGMVTMNDSLLSLVQRRLVDPKQAYLKAVDKTNFSNMLRQAGITPPA